MQWCQETIVHIHSNKSNDEKYIIGIIQWKDEFYAEGGGNPTKEMLRMKEYNTETHGNRSWQEDCHLLNEYLGQLVHM